MKRTFAMLSACLVLVAVLTGCQGAVVSPTPAATSTPAATPTPSPLDGKLEDILARIYETAKIESASDKEFLKTSLATTPIDDKNCEYQLGKAGLKFKEGIASEPIMSSSAYALCLVRVEPGQDIEQLKADIKANVNPMKWICVGVEKDSIIVDSAGEVVVLIMSDAWAKPLHEAFLALAG